MRLRSILAGATLILLSAATAASAEPDLFSRQAFEGSLDWRVAAADGQPSFLDNGFGRTRFGGGGDDATSRLHGALAEAELVWKPQLTWALGAVIDAEYQKGQTHALDLSEAYLTLRPTPNPGLRFSARAGLYYPPVSLEHEGAGWDVANSITPSAINSWIGEEVKVVGAEAKLAKPMGDQELAATVGVFGFNDTSGTLLTFRGWGLHDYKATLLGAIKLPPIDEYMVGAQPQYSNAVLELDHRVGYYARLDWRTPWPASFNAFWYDNRGDRVTTNAELQWAWATRFWNLGATFDLGPHTRVLSQVLSGTTQLGDPSWGYTWIDLRFTSAYVLATHDVGASRFTGRVDVFQVHDKAFNPALQEEDDNRGETGWSLTAAYRLQVAPKAQFRIEAIYADSKRPELEQFSIEPKQRQTQVQTSLRFSF